MEKNYLKKDEDHQMSYIINKYQNFGFNSLKAEELVFTLVTPSFNSEFQKKTG